MTQFKQPILIAALGGAVAGVLATRPALHKIATNPFFACDKALPARWQLLVAVLGWILFSIYWEAAAKSAAQAKTSESKRSRGIHVFLTNAALLLEIAPIRGLGRFVPALPALVLAGLAVEAMRLLLAIWARRHLGRNWSGEITIKVDHQLIRSGPYRLLRHPIYTGLLAMYAGTALVFGEWLAIVGLLLAVIAYGRKIRLEEANLDMAFGANYNAYREESWALMPWVY